jgi:hypothetical protein
MTLSELADMLGCSVSSLHELEVGKRISTGPEVSLLAMVFGLGIGPTRAWFAEAAKDVLESRGFPVDLIWRNK